MKKKIIWMMISGLMVLTLILASCETKTTEKTTEDDTDDVVKITESETTTGPTDGVKDEVQLPPDLPKYGGIHTFVGIEPMGFDPAYTLSVECKHQMYGYDCLLGEDWSKGPAGTGEMEGPFLGLVSFLTGEIAESWDMPDNNTIIYHIRKGVHFWNKAPANGRELDADDIVWNLQRQFDTGPYMNMNVTKKDFPTSIQALDKWTVEIKLPASQGSTFMMMSEQVHYSAPEVAEVHGDLKDWRNVIGTGPWMLMDYVSATQMTFKRNPDYWKYDPVHPENQLPYLNGLKCLFITDASTRQAAFRVGKIDTLPAAVDEATLLLNENPALKSAEFHTSGTSLWGRIDLPELPFKDLKVRKALNMAINRQELVDEYYDGKADILCVPYANDAGHSSMYTPLEEMPESVQEVFSYNPEKAKKLLAEAGYPNGFKTQIICTSAESEVLSIVKEYFLDIGVDMEINVMETGARRSMGRARTYPEMNYGPVVESSFPFKMHMVRSESFDCFSYWEHPYTRGLYEKAMQYVGKDDATLCKMLKEEYAPFVLENCIGIWMPAPYTYRLWWPWVQNFWGSTVLGYDNQECYTHYAWHDEKMKASMGY
ncbi:MAG TPA: ABC transporter substrate-binding protein [Dehalococcoidia bacterium]|nr:ABC transporter substrate-binding protein [Dehalococcoidia bacterium]